MRIPFFRIGKHTASNGQTQDYTGEELDRRVSLYNEQQDHQAPIVVGHPKTNDPAFGWVKSVAREGDLLVAEVDEVHPSFAELITKGLFKKVSASFYGNGLLRHIGFLGATPPAIKGLPAVEFSEEDAETVEADAETFDFAVENEFQAISWRFDRMRRIAQLLRDMLIEDKGVEAADKILPQWEIDGLEYNPPRTTDDAAFADPAFAEAAAAGTEAEAAAVSPREQQLEADLAAERQKTAQLEADAQARTARAEAESFCDAEDLRTRISPAMRPAVVELVLMAGTQEFGEAGENGTKQTLRDALAGILRGLPVYAEFIERVKDGPATSSGSPDEDTAKAVAAAFNDRNR